MGQKTHPKGFRLITNQNWLSSWYSPKKNYSHLSQEDFRIRETVLKKLNDFLIISNIEIFRNTTENQEKECVNIKINALYPRENEMLKKLTDYEKEVILKKSKINNNFKQQISFLLKKKCRNIILELSKYNEKKYTIKFNFIKNQFDDAILIAKFIARQLDKRIPFRRVIKQVIEKAKARLIKGIKIQLSGRLNGIDIARNEWKREGKIPLHTLYNSLDYTCQEVKTVYGVIGIKVWLFKK